MPKTNPNYSDEFKQEVLAYQTSTSSSTRQTAAHFGVSGNSILAWRRRLGAPLGGLSNGNAIESPEQELVRLRRENSQLQMRCEILKKTVSIFSDQSGNDTLRLKR
jgi:transposase-like protein